MSRGRVVANRCGGCKHFVEDFVDDRTELVRGHCHVFPKKGDIHALTSPCPQFDPLPEVASMTPPPASESHPTFDPDDLREVVREAIEDLLDIRDVRLAPRWDGGTLLLKPGKPGLQEREWPLDAFFHKIVLIRDRLRVLEAKLNAHPKLSDAEKVELQQYITRCYGSLTSFNVLFADPSDRFRGESKRR